MAAPVLSRTGDAIRILAHLDRASGIEAAWRLSGQAFLRSESDWRVLVIGLCAVTLPDGRYGPAVAFWATPTVPGLQPLCLALFAVDGELDASRWARRSPPWDRYAGNPLGPVGLANGDTPGLGYRHRRPDWWREATDD